MGSHSQIAPRRQPRQPRGEQRVTELLDAAAEAIAEKGYEAATMSEIAERAGASIGSLYQFFPNKMAVADALRRRCVERFEPVWDPLRAEARGLSIEELVDGLVDAAIGFLENHAVWIALLEAPEHTRLPASLREAYEKKIAGFLLASRPRMSRVKARRLGHVVLHIIKALGESYGEAPASEKRRFTGEYKIALVEFLKARMGAR